MDSPRPFVAGAGCWQQRPGEAWLTYLWACPQDTETPGGGLCAVREGQRAALGVIGNDSDAGAPPFRGDSASPCGSGPCVPGASAAALSRRLGTGVAREPRSSQAGLSAGRHSEKAQPLGTTWGQRLSFSC